MTKPDSITNLTIGAGFFILFTTVISPGFKVLSAFTADCRAGMASAKSFSQSSLIAWAAAAASLARASSQATISFLASTLNILKTILNIG